MSAASRWRTRASALALALLAAGAAAQAPGPAAASWAVALPPGEPVAFHGAPDLDLGSGQAGSMMYPAPHVAVFLAAIAVHGAFAQSQQRSVDQARQARADQVLGPYKPALEGYRHDDLLQRALIALPGRALQAGEGDPAAWRLRSAPVFFMTQDRQALVLRNTVVLHAPGETASPRFQGVLTVVSEPQPEPGYGEGEAEQLKHTAAALLAESITIAMESLAAPPPGELPPERTWRYREGGRERMERAALVAERCGRRWLRTLRGGLMSVPAAGAVGERCAPARAVPGGEAPVAAPPSQPAPAPSVPAGEAGGAPA